MTSSPLIDEALTRRVAALARLELTDEEVRTFTKIAGILGYVEQLQKVDVSGVEPLFHPMAPAIAQELESVSTTWRPWCPWREDEIVEFPRDAEGKPRTLAPAEANPDGVLDGGFKVPPIL